MQFYPFIIFSIKLKSRLLLSTIKVLKLSFFFSRIVFWLYPFAGVAGNALSESETKEEGGALVKSCDKRRHLGRIRFRPYVRSWAGEACHAPTIAPKARTLNLRSLTCFQVFSLASARLCRDEARLAHHVTPRRKIIAMRIEPRPMAVVSLISPM